MSQSDTVIVSVVLFVSLLVCELALSVIFDSIARYKTQNTREIFLYSKISPRVDAEDQMKGQCDASISAQSLATNAGPLCTSLYISSVLFTVVSLWLCS